MGRTLAHRVGADPRFGHDKAKEIVVFEPHAGKDWKVVNVDTTIKKGILRAKELGLVQSRTTDLIFTMEPNFAGQNLYDEENKGRFLGLFRHPVERALSMFFYLQTATWERTYSPEWADMSVMEWASQDHFETDYMVHKLVGKSFGDEVDETDLIIAKELVRQRFIVGLISEMKESIRRFNIVLGVDENSARGHNCMEEYGLLNEPVEAKSEEEGAGDEEPQTMATDKKNSHKHPKVRITWLLFTVVPRTISPVRISSRREVRSLRLSLPVTRWTCCCTSTSKLFLRHRRISSTPSNRPATI